MAMVFRISLVHYLFTFTELRYSPYKILAVSISAISRMAQFFSPMWAIVHTGKLSWAMAHKCRGINTSMARAHPKNPQHRDTGEKGTCNL